MTDETIYQIRVNSNHCGYVKIGQFIPKMLMAGDIVEATQLTITVPEAGYYMLIKDKSGDLSLLRPMHFDNGDPLTVSADGILRRGPRVDMGVDELLNKLNKIDKEVQNLIIEVKNRGIV